MAVGVRVMQLGKERIDQFLFFISINIAVVVVVFNTKKKFKGKIQAINSINVRPKSYR